MKTLLQNEMSQVSGGENKCYAVVDCYHLMDADGKLTLAPTAYSSNICATLGVDATVSDPKVPAANKVFFSTVTLSNDGKSAAVIREGKFIC